MNRLHLFVLLGSLFLAGCGYTQPWDEDRREAAAFAAEATLDARREVDTTDPALEAMIETVVADDKAKLTAEARYDDHLADMDARLESKIATHDAAEATYEAGRVDCVGGCTDYPTWCDDPPIKGNVSFNSGERIYHMQGDDFYEETKIDPDYGEYYFCTPEEAEAAGFRRAYK